MELNGGLSEQLSVYLFLCMFSFLGTRKQNIVVKVLKASKEFGILGCSVYTVFSLLTRNVRNVLSTVRV